MSMSEFEGPPQYTPPRASQQSALPDDFSEEDRLFAQELETLFCPELEQLPPFFAQTLLESDDPRFQPVDEVLHYKTRARVFQRLQLKRRLFHSSRPSFLSILKAPLGMRRPFIGLLVSCMLLMLMTVVLTAPSFASGLNILWSGSHSGVVQVPSYPLPPKTENPSKSGHHLNPDFPTQMSLIEAQKELTFPIYWPLNVPESYTLNGVYLYQGVGQQWADGPLVDMEYQISMPGIIPHGTGKITICEFKPKGKVFQVVQLGSSQQMTIDSQGNAAIYVDGQWEQINNTHSWIYGKAGELIYERNGVIFWITGDQRDGITKSLLLSLAQSFKSFDIEQMMQMMKHIGVFAESGDNSSWAFAREVVYIDNPSGSFMGIVGDDSPPVRSSIAADRANTN